MVDRQTLEMLSGRGNMENNSRKTTVDEGRPLRVGQTRNSTVIDEGRKFTTIDELNQAFLTPDQRAKEEEKLTKTKTANAGRRNADQQRPSDENGKIFEEGDIIDWMFRNIIVAGMNWAGNKVVNAASFVVGGVATATVDYVGKKAKKEWKDYKDAITWLNPYKGGWRQYPETKTTKFQDTVNELHRAELDDSQKFNTPGSRQLLTASMSLLHDGKIDLFNQMMHNKISPETIEALNNIPSEQLRELFSPEQAPQTADLMINTLMGAQQYSANVATARMLQEKAENQDKPKKDPKEVFAQYQAEAKADYLAYMQEAQAAGKDPFKAAEELGKLSIEAYKHANEQINNYQYNEVENTPAPNKYLKKIDELTVISKESPYREKTELNNFAQEIINVSKEQEALTSPISQAEQDLINRTNLNNRRRERLNAVRQNFTRQRDVTQFRPANQQGGR